ncbi:MAG TPA: hypothetical protein PKV57_00255 [Bacilli bacterium]|nr:hypothetical protein [Bacilli bacterium]
MIIIERTTAVVDKTIRDLQRVSFWIALIVQIIFLCLYGLRIYTNLNHIIYLVIYCFLTLTSLFGFFFYLTTYKNKKDKKVLGTKNGIKILKYFANAIMIIIVIVEYVQREPSDLDIIITALSIAFFLIQIVFELVRMAYNKYSDLLMTSLSMDFAKFEILADPKSFILSKLDNPLEKISNKITGVKTDKKELTKTEQYIEQLTNEYKDQKKLLKKTKSDKEKQKIKEHSKVIFGVFKKKNRKKKVTPTNDNSIKQIAKK